MPASGSLTDQGRGWGNGGDLDPGGGDELWIE